MKMNERIITSIIGIIIGCVIGGIMSYSILKEHKNCEMLRHENKMMQDMLYEIQNDGK
jgi:ABC-type antimicrobial peptide transport system permease subunit